MLSTGGSKIGIETGVGTSVNGVKNNSGLDFSTRRDIDSIPASDRFNSKHSTNPDIREVMI